MLYIGVSDGGVAYQLLRHSVPILKDGVGPLHVRYLVTWRYATKAKLHTGTIEFDSLGKAMDVFNACVVRAHTARFLRKVYDATDFHMKVPGGAAW